VKKVATAVKRIEKEHADNAKAEKEKVEKEKAASTPTPQSAPKLAPGTQLKPKKLLTPLEENLGDNFNNLSRWVTTGFFRLPLDLVLELHAHGFTWGATLSTNVDLHHFELDS